MKYGILILLFVGLLLQSFSKSLIMLEFRVNRDYIAEVLCVNKDKPQLQCNGKCHLKKQLEKDNEPARNGTSAKERYEVIFINALTSPNLAPLDAGAALTAYYQDKMPLAPTHAFFHPPQA
jgi:hypothetical protein